jgi:hypothetical protein
MTANSSRVYYMVSPRAGSRGNGEACPSLNHAVPMRQAPPYKSSGNGVSSHRSAPVTRNRSRTSCFAGTDVGVTVDTPAEETVVAGTGESSGPVPLSRILVCTFQIIVATPSRCNTSTPQGARSLCTAIALHFTNYSD